MMRNAPLDAPGSSRATADTRIFDTPGVKNDTPILA